MEEIKGVRVGAAEEATAAIITIEASSKLIHSVNSNSDRSSSRTMAEACSITEGQEDS